MPNCRNCGSRLSKFDKDICPVCGFKHPLDGVSSETQEVTSEISFYKGELKTSKVRKRWLTLLLFIFAGPLGIGYFYLKHLKKAIFWLIINILCIALATIIALVVNQEIWLYALLIALGVSYFVNILLGIYIFFRKDYKDGNGELIR